MADTVARFTPPKFGEQGRGSVLLGGNVAYYVANVYGTVFSEVE